MATRYWVGGTGTWSNANTANWSASSGGASGASVPTSVDDVVFDGNSNGGFGTFTVTLDSTGTPTCRGWTNLSVTVPMTFNSNGVVSFNVYGALTFNATRTTIGATNFTWLFQGSGGTINTNGVSMGSNGVTFNSSTGSWTLAAALTGVGVFNLATGSVDTAGFAVSCLRVTSLGAATRSLTLGATTFTCTAAAAWNVTSSLSLSAGTSSLVMSSSGITFTSGGLTYYNISFTNNNNGTHTLADGFTANSLTFAAQTNTTSSIVLSGNISLTTNISVPAGATVNLRQYIYSSLVGVPRTITCGTNVTSFGNVDLRDISFNAPTSVTGTSIGNAGGNSGVTFTAAKTVYWNLVGGGTYASAVAYALTPTGTPSLANFPLPQDTLVFTNAGINSAVAVTFNQRLWLPNWDASGLTNTPSFVLTAGPTLTGSLFMGGFNFSSTGTITFSNRNPSFASVNVNSKSTSALIVLECPGGGIKVIGSNLTTTNANGFSHLSGTLDLSAGFNVSAQKYASTYTNSLARAVIFGGSIILTTSGTAVFNLTNDTGMTVSGSGGYVKLTYSGAASTTVVCTSSSATSAFPFWFSAGTYALTFLNLSTYAANRVDFTGFAGTWTNTFAAGGAYLYGDLTISSGMSFSASSYTTPLNVGAADANGYAITTNGKTIPFAIVVNAADTSGYIYTNGAYTTSNASGVTLSNGTLDLNGNTMTTPIFQVSGGSNVKNITFRGGTITTSGNFSVVGGTTNLTTSIGAIGPGYIVMTSASPKTFAGGGFNYAATLQQSGAGALTVDGSNTFYDITNSTQPVTVSFTAGTTNTFTNFSLAGTLGNQVTINSTTSATHTLSKGSGSVNVSYCSISYSVATGGAAWNAYITNGNVDNGNNTGWNFTAPAPTAGSKFLMVF